ncbi:hypothetical protein [uncultured Shewanella sp.]|uniref:hypothetical protein n=1 Tax=uncultured Shewanella sp. TaxID=173975 RepID=UPI00262388B9|nr:hypothetical protein [uncultured Shewanella sp.]
MKISYVHNDNYYLLKLLNVVEPWIAHRTVYCEDPTSLIAREVDFQSEAAIDGTLGLSLLNFNQPQPAPEFELIMYVNPTQKWVLAKSYEQKNPPFYIPKPPLDKPNNIGPQKNIDTILHNCLTDLFKQGAGEKWIPTT